jgi:hypothetical protein
MYEKQGHFLNRLLAAETRKGARKAPRVRMVMR